MNDHIPKPIKVEEMFATLARWVRPAVAGEAGGLGPAANADSRAALLALPGIDCKTALAGLMDDAALFRRLLCLFRDRESDFPRRFGAARAAGDVEAAVRAAHDLKSESGTLAMQSLEHAAAALEQACKAGVADADIEALVCDVTGLLATVIAGLQGLQR